MGPVRPAVAWMWGAVVALALLASEQAAAEPAPPRVTAAQPVERRVTVWDEYWGRFEAVESVEVRARVSGFIDKVHFKDGDTVKAGQLLYSIDPRPFRIALESAEAEIARARAQVALGESEVERARPLLRSNVVTERDFDQRRANLAVAKAQLQAAEAAARSAKLNLEWSEVKAPISGRISDAKVDEGNLVVGGNVTGSTLLTTIVQLDPIHFVFDAAEADYLRYARMRIDGTRPSSRDKPNPVKLKLADEEEFTHDGHMDFVDNQLNARSGTIRARAIFENKSLLLAPGMFGRLKLFGGEMTALLVPDSALVSDQTRKLVYVVGEDGMLKAAAVTLGPIEEGLRVVKSGIARSDRIVIDGLASPFVRPGSKVTAEPGEIKAAAAPAAQVQN